MSISGIAHELHRSRNVIQSFLSNPGQYGNAKRTGSPKTLTDTAWRRVLRETSEGNMSSTGSVKALQLEVKPRRIPQVLHSISHLQYTRIIRTTAMRIHHDKFVKLGPLER